MKNKQPIIRALDIGYGAVKFVRGTMPNGNPMVDVFPSIIKQLDSLLFTSSEIDGPSGYMPGHHR